MRNASPGPGCIFFSCFKLHTLQENKLHCNLKHSPAGILQILILSFFPLVTFGQKVTDAELIWIDVKTKDYLASNRFKEAENLQLKYLAIENFRENRGVRGWLVQNLGFLYETWGLYDLSITYYNLALELENSLAEPKISYVVSIYSHLATNYLQKNMYQQARDYFDKSLRLTMQHSEIDRRFEAGAQFGLGQIYNYLKKYELALYHLQKSMEVSQKHHLKNIGPIYIYRARVLENLGRTAEAGEYFARGIDYALKEINENNPQIIPNYFFYGQFLLKTGKINKALTVQKKALDLCLAIYGNKHTFTSLAYKNVGDVFMAAGDYDSALFNYQRSLISVVPAFNNMDIFINPDPENDSVLYQNRLAEDLKAKAKALNAIALKKQSSNEKIKWLNAGVSTIESAVSMVEIIRSNYLSEENRVFLAESQKEAYLTATDLYNRLYDVTGDNSLKRKMYRFCEEAKSATLMNDITGNALIDSRDIPDSVISRRNTLQRKISEFSRRIEYESGKEPSDSMLIVRMKDTLFNATRDKERVDRIISKSIPGYFDLLRRTSPLPVSQIQKKLDRKETVVDYLLDSRYVDGKRKIYYFVLTRDSMFVREGALDSAFLKNAEIIRKTADPDLAENNNPEAFRSYAEALHYMYVSLIRPVEQYFAGNDLIIIPDEELETMPFEAFLKNAPGEYQTDFEGLDFLLKEYSISYTYSPSFIALEQEIVKNQSKVVSFSPDYSTSETAIYLKGTEEETQNIHKWFSGRNYTGDSATREAFLKELANPSCLHLALHTMEDSMNSSYSYMLFAPDSIKNQLYNYEISLSRLKSPMVVLSSCNSGSGTLYSGSGVMSIARSFFLAGARSVVKTSWEVNDQSGSEIIKLFYYYLSKGMSKDKALRKAKLEFMKKSSPSFSNPYYWAAYTVLGDDSPVRKKNEWYYYGGAALVILAVLLYFKRRRIFPARSL